MAHFEHLNAGNEKHFLAETIAPANHSLKSHANTNMNENKNTMSEEKLTALYFQQLDEKDVMDLYRVVHYL